MKKSSMFIVTVASAIVVSAIVGARAGSMMSAKPTAVSVVDVFLVRGRLDEAKQIGAEMEQELQQFQQEDKVRTDKVKELEEDIKVLQQDSEALKQKQTELLYKAIETKTWREVKKAQLGSDHAIQLERLYHKIVDASKAVAELNGYDIVLAKERDIDFSKNNSKEIDALISLRTLVWSRDEVEITESVIQKMNNDFKNNL